MILEQYNVARSTLVDGFIKTTEYYIIIDSYMMNNIMNLVYNNLTIKIKNLYISFNESLDN